MEIKSDIRLRGTAWDTAISKLSSIFSTRTNYTIYMLCMAIGIMYDKRITKLEDGSEDDHSVPRNVINNNDNGKLDFYFQAAILTTTTECISEENRLELAFGDSIEFEKLTFLTQFANFGVTKLVELIGDTDLESMDNIKNFMVSSVEGRNFDIDELTLDILEIEV